MSRSTNPNETPQETEPPSRRIRLASIRDYLEQSQGLSNSFALIAPVFLLYQTGIIIQLSSSNSGAFALNGADWFTGSLLGLFQGSLPLYTGFVALLIIGFVFGMNRLSAANKLQRRLFVPIILESTCYALLLGTSIHLMMGIPSVLASVGVLSAGLVPSSFGMKVFHAMGAGFNEEIIFRLGALGGTLSIGRKLKINREVLLVLGVTLASLAFSAFHYLGPYGDVFLLNTFMFRFLAGILLSIIYLWRGLAIAVYTHAMYDLYFFLVVLG